MANAQQALDDFRGDNLSLKMFGAKGDTRVFAANTAAGSAIISSSNAQFSAADVGKRVVIYGAAASGRISLSAQSTAAVTSADTYAVALTLDCQSATAVKFAANCVTYGVTWQVFGANNPTFAGEVSVHGPEAITPLAPSVFFVDPAPIYHYYRIKIVSSVAGLPGLCYLTGCALGYVLGTSIVSVQSTTQATLGTSAGAAKTAAYALMGTDDTAAINAAIAYAASRRIANTADGGITLKAPVGNYLFSSPIFQKACVTIKGGHSASTIFYADGAGMPSGVPLWNMTGTLQTDNQIAFFTRLEDVRIDCGHVPGSIGIFCDALQEQSGLYRTTVIQWLQYGIQIGSGSDRYGCNNWVIQDPNVYPSNTAFLNDSVRGIIANYAPYTTIIRGTVFGQGGFICGYGKCVDFSNSFLICQGQLHMESGRIGLHFNAGSGGTAASVDTQSFVQIAVQIDAGNPVGIGFINSAGQTSVVDNVQNNTVVQSQLSRYICNPISMPEVLAGALQFMQSVPSGGPNVITIDPVNFGTDQQGGFIAVNSRNAGYPNWIQTSGSVGYTKAMFMRLAAAAFEIMIGAATNSNGVNPGASLLYVDDIIGGIRTPRLYFDAPGFTGPLNFGNNTDVNRARWWHGGTGQALLKLQRSTNSGGSWADVISIDLTTGKITETVGQEIDNGYGTSPASPNDLFIGAGGGAPNAASFAFGDGSGYRLNLIANVGGSPTVFATFVDSGQFSTGWVGAGVSSPSSGSSTFDATEGRCGVLGVGGAADHTAAHPLQVWGPILSTSLTPSTPVLTDAAKALISAQIDLSSSVHVKASGLSAGKIMQWSGSAVAGISGIASGNVTEITSGPTSASFLTNAFLSGTIPPGLTLSIASNNAVTGFGVATHAVTNGIITS